MGTTAVESSPWTTDHIVAMCDAGMRDRDIRRVLATIAGPDHLAEMDPGRRRSLGLPDHLGDSSLPDGVWAIGLCDARYPAALAATAAPPPVLYGIGDPSALSTGVAVIGSRRLSTAGRRVAAAAAESAVAHGLVVVSGGAVGADTIAHTAAVDAAGRTVAVVASAVDDLRADQTEMASRILDAGGAIVSEQRSSPERFGPALLARNRIIVGLASVVVVAGAAPRSGSMNAALCALDADRALVVAPPLMPEGPDAEGVALLADARGVDPALLGATGRVAAKAAARAPVANAVVRTPRQLAEVIAVAHHMRACP